MNPREKDSEQANENHEYDTQKNDRYGNDDSVYDDGEHDRQHKVNHIAPEVMLIMRVIDIERKPRTYSKDDHEQNEFHHGITKFPMSSRRIARIDNSMHMKSISEKVFSFSALK